MCVNPYVALFLFIKSSYVSSTTPRCRTPGEIVLSSGITNCDNLFSICCVISLVGNTSILCCVTEACFSIAATKALVSADVSFLVFSIFNLHF